MRLTTRSANPVTTNVGEASFAAMQEDVRSKAQAVLASLVAAKAECDQQLAKLRRPDAMKQVTGKSSLDEAISSTKRLLAELDEAAEASHAKPCSEVEIRIGGAVRREAAVA